MLPCHSHVLPTLFDLYTQWCGHENRQVAFLESVGESSLETLERVLLTKSAIDMFFDSRCAYICSSLMGRAGGCACWDWTRIPGVLPPPRPTENNVVHEEPERSILERWGCRFFATCYSSAPGIHRVAHTDCQKHGLLVVDPFVTPMAAELGMHDTLFEV